MKNQLTKEELSKDLQELRAKRRSFNEEFREFINRGNILDLAVGVAVGGAFTAIVTSLVNDIIMPTVGLILGGVDFASLSITVGSASIAYGKFIQSVVNFVLIAFCVFLLIKFINNLRESSEKAAERTKQRAEALKAKLAADRKKITCYIQSPSNPAPKKALLLSANLTTN